MTTYTLTLSATQMHVLSRAAEVIARLGIGQIPDALRELPTRDGIELSAWHDDCEAVCKIMSKHMPHSIDGFHSSLGIHNAGNSTRIAWDLHQVMRHRLSWDRAIAAGHTDGTTRNWSEMLGVSYDEPSRTCQEPLALVVVAVGSAPGAAQ